MKKILLLGAVCCMLSADVKTVNISPDEIKKYDQIVDIRTPSEWQETGIIAGAKTITFDILSPSLLFKCGEIILT